jgi:hypothetical protein
MLAGELEHARQVGQVDADTQGVRNLIDGHRLEHRRHIRRQLRKIEMAV